MNFAAFVELLKKYSYPGYVWKENALLSAYYNKFLPRTTNGWHNPDNPEHKPFREDYEEFAKELAEEHSRHLKPVEVTEHE